MPILVIEYDVQFTHDLCGWVGSYDKLTTTHIVDGNIRTVYVCPRCHGEFIEIDYEETEKLVKELKKAKRKKVQE